MAGIAVTLKQARELYVKMGEAAATLEQAASEGAQNYERMENLFHQTGAAARECQNELLAVRRELKSAVSHLFWLILLTTFTSGVLAALFVRFLT